MTNITTQSWIQQFELISYEPPDFFYKIDQINSYEPPMPQTNAMRRAWQDMDLNGILCIDKIPAIYFKEVDSIDAKSISKLHRQLWNQSIAPILIVISPIEIQVYSGLSLPSQKAEEIFDQSRLIKTFERISQALEIRSFIKTIETGEVFNKYSKSFNPDLKVDKYLLDNITAACNLLEKIEPKHLSRQSIHSLLGRLIFICYLIDREVIRKPYLENIGAIEANNLLDILQLAPNKARELLYNLFEQLKKDFNGNVFEGNLENEKQLINDEHIEVLKSFLHGDKLETGQLSLGFWAYDFSVIPIETISAIYDRFLGVEGKTIKKELGAYYTPRFLTEVLLDIALQGCTPLLGKKFLDPACGSGIFLVALFNRLAEEWKRKNKTTNNQEQVNALINILQNNIFGIDKSETACQIAAFSLYLALLDQLSSRDIQELQSKSNLLPKLVLDKTEVQDRHSGNILCADFFDQDLDSSLDKLGKFDLILGNPPWIRENTSKITPMEIWCQKEKLPVAQRQRAYGFIWKAPYYLKEKGKVCFLLPAGVLFNRQDKALEAQKEWFSRYTLEEVLNLSDMCFYLFEGAVRPALIVKYRNEKPEKLASIQYYVPKTEVKTLKANILVISPEDHVKIKIKEILVPLSKQEIPSVWKQCFWATPRDRKFLDRLSSFPKLSQYAGNVDENKRWIIGRGIEEQGIKDNPKNIKVNPWFNSEMFLEGTSENIDLLLIPSDCTNIGDRFKYLRRLPSKEIFTAPHVVVTKGFKSAYADFDFIFKDTFSGIQGSQKDRLLLMFLGAFFNSKLSDYFLFHTSSNWGIERKQILISELLSIPFPFPEETLSPNQAIEIINEVVHLMNKAKDAILTDFSARKPIIQNIKQQILTYIYKYYDIDEFEQVLIEDTINVYIPSSTPTRNPKKIPMLESTTRNDRKNYTDFFCNVLNGWIKKSSYSIIGNVVICEEIGIGIITIIKNVGLVENVSYKEENSNKALSELLLKMAKLLPEQEGKITFTRSLKVFDQNNLYICKPLSKRYWTKTAALNDADEIAFAIISQNYGKVK